MPTESSRSTTPPSPRAPAVNPVPLPSAAGETKKYSEGEMYDELPEEDIQAWHRRYANYQKWRQEIPSKRLKELGATSSSTATFGRGVGVGSADWNWNEGELSDTGTIPSTIVYRKQDADRAERISGKMISKASSRPTPALTPAAGSNANVPTANQQSRLPAQTQTRNPTELPAQAQTAKRQGSTIKLSRQEPNATAPSAQTALAPPNIVVTQSTPSKNETQTQRPGPSRVPAASRIAPVPALAQRPSLTHSAAGESFRSNSGLKPTSRIPSTRVPRAPAPAPGELVIPSPTPSATHAEREAYLASTIDLPLDMLRETQQIPGAGPSRALSSSRLTTSRLGSLLGQSRDNLKVASQRSSSSTTLPSVASARHATRGDQQGSAALVRSHTVAETHSRRSEMVVGDVVPGTQRLPNQQTSTRLQPQTQHAESQASHTQTQILPVRSQHSHAPTASAPKPPSHQEPTLIRAAQQPLPSSKADTIITQIRVPVSVVTAAGSQPTPAPTQTQPSGRSSRPASQAYSPSTQHRTAELSVAAPVAEHTRYTVRDAPASRQPSRANPHHKTSSALEPYFIPLPSTVPTIDSAFGDSNSPASQPAPSHRQQRLPLRPALTPQGSFDGLSRATSLGRRQRDPSLADLTARFEPAMYPLPPSGGTLFSSPEAVPTDPTAPKTRSERTVNMPPSRNGPESGKSTSGLRAPPTSPTAPVSQSHTIQQALSQVPKRSVAPSANAARFVLLSSAAAPSPTLSKKIPSQALRHEASIATSLPHRPSVPVPGTTRSVDQHNVQHHTVEIVPPPVAFSPYHEPTASENVTFSPPASSQRVRQEDDHVSFEVPSGSRGRLRVTLKWLKEGPRSIRRQSISSVGSPPPPVPPKPHTVIDRLKPSNSRSHPARSRRDDTRDPPEQPEELGSPLHPLPQNERPNLDPPPTKRVDTKRHDERQSQYAGGIGAEPGHYYHPNPYYSGGTLPAYNAAQPQVYNMQMPFAYPQPNPNLMGCAYRPQPQGLGPQGNMPESPARESVDPPSVGSPENQPAPLPMGYPSRMFGISTDTFPNMSPQQQQQQRQQGLWNLRNLRNQNRSQNQNQGKTNVWSRIFGKRPQQGGGGDDLSPDDSVTIRNWSRQVPAGRAPTLAPIRPVQSQSVYPDRRPTMTIVPRNDPFAFGQSTIGERTGNGMTHRYRPYEHERGGKRASSTWDKLFYRRAVDERVYVSPRRRNVPLPAPVPSYHPETQHPEHDRDRGSKKRYLSPGWQDRSKRSAEGEKQKRDAEKEQRRKERAARRDQRAGGSGSAGLSHENLIRNGTRDRSTERERGRSGTMVTDWVSRVRKKRYPAGAPPNSTAQTDYRSWRTRLGIKSQSQPATMNRRTGTGAQGTYDRMHGNSSTTLNHDRPRNRDRDHERGRSDDKGKGKGSDRRGTLRRSRSERKNNQDNSTSDGNRIFGRIGKVLNVGLTPAGSDQTGYRGKPGTQAQANAQAQTYGRSAENRQNHGHGRSR